MARVTSAKQGDSVEPTGTSLHTTSDAALSDVKSSEGVVVCLQGEGAPEATRRSPAAALHCENER